MINVLIVEDDPMVAEFNRKYMEQVEGFRCGGWASSVEEARKFIAEQAIDLILLDVYMQESNGIDLLSFIRETGVNIDVIVISAASDMNSVKKAMNFGAVDYLIKPFHFNRFLIPRGTESTLASYVSAVYFLRRSWTDSFIIKA